MRACGAGWLNRGHSRESVAQMTFAWFVIALLVVAAIYSFLRWILPLLQVTVRTGTNNHSSAKENFLELLEAAEKEIIIHDDGNRMEDSPYEDREILDAMRRIVRERDVAIRCLFNYDEGLALTRELSGVVEIRVRKEASLGAHYKIADSGKLAYLSWHGVGENRRAFRLIDCRSVPKYARPWVTERLLGEYVESFDGAFKGARRLPPVPAALQIRGT